VNSCVVVTEGPTDVAILQALVGSADTRRNVKFVAAGGWSAADALARSLLVHGTTDVALAVDADTTDPASVEEHRGYLRRSLAMIASPARSHITLFVPEIEVLFFEDGALLEALVGQKVRDEDLLRGRYEPKRTLARLLGGGVTPQVFVERLPALDLEIIREASPVRELRTFVRASELSALAA
jgi:hypothetical protein